MSKVSNTKRILAPTIIETKQELLTALKTGQLKTSKYNLLSEREKMFVELLAFGNYTAEQAVKILDPNIRATTLIANRLMANPAVADTLDELTSLRDKKFMAEVASTRDLALNKLKYIMSTTADDSLAAACAKTILDKSVDLIKHRDKNKDEAVSGITFKIQVDSVNVNSGLHNREPVVIPIEVDEESPNETADSHKVEINPNTGLPYTIVYEGVNLYGTDK